MVIVNSLFVTADPDTVKSVPKAAPLLSLPATDTVTSVAVVNTDEEPAKLAVTTTSAASPSPSAV